MCYFAVLLYGEFPLSMVDGLPSTLTFAVSSTNQQTKELESKSKPANSNNSRRSRSGNLFPMPTKFFPSRGKKPSHLNAEGIKIPTYFYKNYCTIWPQDMKGS